MHPKRKCCCGECATNFCGMPLNAGGSPSDRFMLAQVEIRDIEIATGCYNMNLGSATFKSMNVVQAPDGINETYWIKNRTTVSGGQCIGEYNGAGEAEPFSSTGLWHRYSTVGCSGTPNDTNRVFGAVTILFTFNAADATVRSMDILIREGGGNLLAMLFHWQGIASIGTWLPNQAVIGMSYSVAGIGYYALSSTGEARLRICDLAPYAYPTVGTVRVDANGDPEPSPLMTMMAPPQDPQAAALRQRQAGGCRGCGDPGAEGVL